MTRENMDVYAAGVQAAWDGKVVNPHKFDTVDYRRWECGYRVGLEQLKEKNGIDIVESDGDSSNDSFQSISRKNA